MLENNEKLPAIPKLSSQHAELYEPYRALYIHIPFCKQRCTYCDFKTEALPSDDLAIESYLEQTIREIRTASKNSLLGSIESIYIGGGTPTFIGAKHLVNLIYTISLSVNLKPTTEFTLEANPDSITPALVRDVFALGVNRFSLGVQSFVDKELGALGRVHTAKQAHGAIETILERCENVSVDLMCGIPVQDLASWSFSLEQALTHQLTHLSIYPLTVEEGTPLAAAVARGALQPANEDLQADMMVAASKMLGKAGFERYEVASYARTGENKQNAASYRSKHNTAYWTGVPYLGIGEHAASMRIKLYGGECARERLMGNTVIESLSHKEAVLEDLMLGMRLADGVLASRIVSASQELPELTGIMEELQALMLVEEKAGRFVPTTQGWLLGNELFSRFILS
ncbi:MAG: radical SAM family heme chaperone HemW [Coriobacteriales bacterium]|jgi:oxygen-independent coproporphyrinogen-3 oxidase|nr:radical SAM family heme chaperone HemW [Coriobacteriales bacterium]